MEAFVKELTVTRNKVVNAASTEIALSSLKDLKDSMIAYLNMLNFIKSKINFGNDQFSLKVEFVWRDTVKDSNVSSYNIAYEINCVLFNLAVCNNFLAKLVNPDTDDELKLKESIKQLEFCAGILDKIKTELPAAMAEKDIPMDLNANYLQFVIKTFCFKFYSSALSKGLIYILCARKYFYKLIKIPNFQYHILSIIKKHIYKRSNMFTILNLFLLQLLLKFNLRKLKLKN